MTRRRWLLSDEEELGCVWWIYSFNGKMNRSRTWLDALFISLSSDIFFSRLFVRQKIQILFVYGGKATRWTAAHVGRLPLKGKSIDFSNKNDFPIIFYYCIGTVQIILLLFFSHRWCDQLDVPKRKNRPIWRRKASAKTSPSKVSKVSKSDLGFDLARHPVARRRRWKYSSDGVGIE